jgi:hypothetical protein
MQMGSSVGVAVLNTVAVTAMAAALSADVRVGRPSCAADAMAAGFATASGRAGGILIVGAVVALLLVRVPRPQPRQHTEVFESAAGLSRSRPAKN